MQDKRTKHVEGSTTAEDRIAAEAAALRREVEAHVERARRRAEADARGQR